MIAAFVRRDDASCHEHSAIGQRSLKTRSKNKSGDNHRTPDSDRTVTSNRLVGGRPRARRDDDDQSSPGTGIRPAAVAAAIVGSVRAGRPQDAIRWARRSPPRIAPTCRESTNARGPNWESVPRSPPRKRSPAAVQPADRVREGGEERGLDERADTAPRHRNIAAGHRISPPPTPIAERPAGVRVFGDVRKVSRHQFGQVGRWYSAIQVKEPQGDLSRANRRRVSPWRSLTGPTGGSFDARGPRHRAELQAGQPRG